MQATERAMREAALRLMSERGYDATSTDDIARAAGVSPRTFFNYFASKDAVVLLPEGVFLELVTSALDARPAGEDPAAAVAAAIMGAFRHFDLLIGPDAAQLMRAQLRLMFAVPEVRRLTFDRRVKVEDVVWDRLRAHGVAAEDLGAAPRSPRSSAWRSWAWPFGPPAMTTNPSSPSWPAVCWRPPSVPGGGGSDRGVPHASDGRAATKFLQ